MSASTAYETLVNAGSSLIGAEVLEDWEEAEITAVESFVADNRDALESAREALRARPSVPVRYEPSFISEDVEGLQHLRNLSRAFALELRLAATQGDFTRASEIGIDMLELASAARRGGLVVHFLVSVALSGIAIEQLRRLRPRFNDLTRKGLMDALCRIEQDQEPFREIAERDRQWETTVGCAEERIDFTNHELRDPAECGMSEDDQRAMLRCIQALADLPKSELQSFYADQDRHLLALMRMLCVDLAIRSHHEANLSYPRDLASLVPDILDRLPLDPFTDQPFVYRKASEGSFMLYSPGPSGIDHGGVFGPWLICAAGGVDVCLDSNDYCPE